MTTTDELLAVDAVTTVRSVTIEDGGRLSAGSTVLADKVFDELHQQRAWWTRAHLTVEVARWISEPSPLAMLQAADRSVDYAARDVAVLCLSATAARVVTEETGMAAHTIASWRIGHVELPHGGVVIVDEASMVPTLVLDELVAATRRTGSRLTLVGDYAQMGAPGAGGLLRDLAAHSSTVHLTSVRRFRNEWERTASTRLRNRDTSVITTINDTADSNRSGQTSPTSSWSTPGTPTSSPVATRSSSPTPLMWPPGSRLPASNDSSTPTISPDHRWVSPPTATLCTLAI